jgi:hypothetical protein
MKILKSQIKQIIKEEYNKIISEAQAASEDAEFIPKDNLKGIESYTSGLMKKTPITGTWKTGEQFRLATGMSAATLQGGAGGNLLGDFGMFKISGTEGEIPATLRKADAQEIVLYVPATQKDIKVTPSQIISVKPEIKSMRRR